MRAAVLCLAQNWRTHRTLQRFNGENVICVKRDREITEGFTRGQLGKQKK
jgi:hypothetical protein